MLNSTEPNDSPILRFLNQQHPNLPTEKKQKLIQNLSESGIPATDKIFPWVVETALLRVEIAELKAKLVQSERQLALHPEQLKSSLELVLKPYLEEVGRSRMASQKLTEELRAAAVIDASLAESGWRGIGAAFAAVFKHQNLLFVMGIFVAVGGVLGLAIAWNLGGYNRRIVERNREVIQQCNLKNASDPDSNGWYTCPGWQLPMPRN